GTLVFREPMPKPGSAPNDPSAREGLECSIGKARVALPIDSVQQVLEYEVGSPPPLSRRWVGGLGMHGDLVLVSVALVPATKPTERRTAKGILLRTERRDVLWALEINAIGARVQVSLTGKPPPSKEKVPSW